MPWPISGRGEEGLATAGAAPGSVPRRAARARHRRHRPLARGAPGSESSRRPCRRESRELLAELEKVAAGHPVAEVAVGPGEPGSGEVSRIAGAGVGRRERGRVGAGVREARRAAGAAADVCVRAAPLLGGPLPGVGGRRPDRAGEAAGRGGVRDRPGRGLACRRGRPVAHPGNSLRSGGCKSAPAGVLGSRNSTTIAASCVLGGLDFRSPAHQRISRTNHRYGVQTRGRWHVELFE